MSSKAKDLGWLIALISCVFVFSANIALMYNHMEDGYISRINVISGITFWLTLIICICIIIKIQLNMRRWCHKHGIEEKNRKKLAILSFFSNRWAMVIDTLFIVSAIGLVVTVRKEQWIGESSYLLTANVVFVSCMHCLINSRMFYYVVNQDKILKKLNRRREKISEGKGNRR